MNPLVSLDVDENVYMIYFGKKIHSNQMIWCLAQSNVIRLINNILYMIYVFLKLYKKEGECWAWLDQKKKRKECEKQKSSLYILMSY